MYPSPEYDDAGGGGGAGGLISQYVHNIISSNGTTQSLLDLEEHLPPRPPNPYYGKIEIIQR